MILNETKTLFGDLWLNSTLDQFGDDDDDFTIFFILPLPYIFEEISIYIFVFLILFINKNKKLITCIMSRFFLYKSFSLDKKDNKNLFYSLFFTSESTILNIILEPVVLNVILVGVLIIFIGCFLVFIYSIRWYSQQQVIKILKWMGFNVKLVFEAKTVEFLDHIDISELEVLMDSNFSFLSIIFQDKKTWDNYLIKLKELREKLPESKNMFPSTINLSEQGEQKSFILYDKEYAKFIYKLDGLIQNIEKYKKCCWINIYTAPVSFTDIIYFNPVNIYKHDFRINYKFYVIVGHQNEKIDRIFFAWRR
jgi:hypothetical protein